MEVFISLFCCLFQKKPYFFAVNPKYWRNGRADPEKIQSERGQKACRLPYAQSALAEKHTDQKQCGRTVQAKQHVADQPRCLPCCRTDLPQQVIKQSRGKPGERRGGDGYRLCADRDAHLSAEQARPQRAAGRPLLIAKLVDPSAQLQDPRVKIDPVDVQRLAADRQFAHVRQKYDHVFVKAGDVAHARQTQLFPVFHLQRVRAGQGFAASFSQHLAPPFGCHNTYISYPRAVYATFPSPVRFVFDFARRTW